jgi:beta-lactam-binding protein with PASTA domain
MNNCVLRGLILAGLLALPAVAMGASTGPKVMPNVVHLEAGRGQTALVQVGVTKIGRYTINCPTLHVGRSLRIAWQSPAAGSVVHPGQLVTLVVARHAQPKSHRTDPLPQGLSRAHLCATVSR